MLLTTTRAELVSATEFAFVVPGDRIWRIRSVIAVAARGAGGAPSRSYLLVVQTSTGPVAANGALDAGGEPGTCTVTWCNCPPSAVESGASGVVVAPFNPPVLEPGYRISGTIQAPAGADAWVSATAWYEFAPTGTP